MVNFFTTLYSIISFTTLKKSLLFKGYVYLKFFITIKSLIDDISSTYTLPIETLK